MAFETLRAKLELDAGGFKKELQEAQDDLGEFGSRTERLSSKMRSVGTMMTASVTAPLAAMGAMAVRQTGTFNRAMAESMSVMDSVSESMEEDLRDTAREVATSTEHSHRQSAKALYFLSSAGLDAAESMEALPAAANFATAGQLQMSEATSVLTTTMRAYGRSASEMTDITDTLSAVVSDSNTTMGDMSTAMSQVGPVAASLGMSLAETSAAIGEISDSGVQGERAGTALRNVMAQLSDETSTASTQLREMGVKTRDAQGDVLPMVDLLRNMEAAGVDAGQAAKIFGMEAAPAMAALMKQGAGSLQSFTEEVENADGATQRMSKTQRDTLNSSLKMARSELNDVAIAAGSKLVPAVSMAAEHVGTASDAFTGLSDGQQKAIVGMAGVLALTGPVIAGLGTLSLASAAVTGGLGTLSAAAGIASGAMATASATTSAYATSLLTTLIPASAVGQTSLYGLASAALAAQVSLGPVTVPAYLLLGALTALAGGAVLLYKKFRGNLGPLDDLVDKVFGFIGGKIDWLRDKILTMPGIDGEDIAPDPDEIDNSGWKDEFKDELDNVGDNAGQSAGKQFGNSFAKSAVESLRTGDVADSLKDELKSVREEKAGVDTMDNVSRARKLQDKIERLEDQIAKVENADSIADLDKELVAEVAAEDIKTDRREEEFASDVVELLNQQGIKASGGSGEQKQSQGPPQVMIDATESESSQQKRQKRLSKMLMVLKQLREEMLKPGDSLDLSGVLDVQGDVATIEDVQAELRRSGRRAENRGFRQFRG